MESFLIKGGVPLHGEVTVGGAKNAVLPIMAATLLTPEPCVIRRVPDLSDVRFMGQILNWLGAKVSIEGDSVRVEARKIRGQGDYDLVRKMRGSICILGPLLGRLRKARVSLPGGCVIGARPINLHLKGVEALGAKIRIEGGYVEVTAKRLVGSAMFLGGRAGSTVLGTANVMMAAVRDRKRRLRTGSRGSGKFPERDGRENFRRRQPHHHHHRSQGIARHRTRSHSGPHRSGNLRHRRGCNQRRSHDQGRTRRTDARGH
jgi:UDP-N-acetylglucosamine enolpyruvyl transferase